MNISLIAGKWRYRGSQSVAACPERASSTLVAGAIFNLTIFNFGLSGIQHLCRLVALHYPIFGWVLGRKPMPVIKQARGEFPVGF
jgi:hypothetical protein